MNERELGIIRRITGAIKAIQQDVHAVHEQYRSGEEKKHPPTEVNINSEIRLPPTVNDYYASENSEGPKDRRRDRVRLVVESVTLVAAVLAAIFAYRSFGQVKRQADAAQGQVGAMQTQLNNSIESFRVDERAWVEISRIDLTRVIPSEGGFPRSFVYDVRLKNIGRTVARDVVVKASNPSSGFDLSSDAHGLDMIQNEKFVDNKTGKPTSTLQTDSIPNVIAPATETPLPFVFAASEPQFGYKMYSFFVGRIDYVDAFNISHWSTFCVFVSNVNGDLRYCKVGNNEDRNPETPPR